MVPLSQGRGSVTTPPKKSDLGVRTLSAVVMVAVAGTALGLGGWVWTAFVVLVALGVLWEWWGLVGGFVKSPIKTALWFLAGFAYIGIALVALINQRHIGDMMQIEFSESVRGTRWIAMWPTLLVIFPVIAVDVGAYFAGRTFGGPKIAPDISPSKTWSGLLGGIIAASATFAIGEWVYLRSVSSCHLGPCGSSWTDFIWSGTLIAVAAQAGDFFESWMKRRAGVKDSGNLIPGHGGLFDRADGLLAVCFVYGLMLLWPYLMFFPDGR
jgi:phosphatidate cytidylyltransferase